MNLKEEKKEIRKWAKKYNESLLAGDFNSNVKIKHQDGSVLEFRNAFLIRKSDKWLICFTEHLGFYIFYIQDLFEFYQNQFIQIKEIE